MKKHWLFALMGTSILGLAAMAQTGMDYYSVYRGGKLYDHWTEQIGQKAPEGNQALWATQTTNTRKGDDTYRCKECHGWDYKGKDGAYATGSRRTGFAGVIGVSRKTTTQISAALKGANPQHDFSKLLSDENIADLTNFLKFGLMDYGTLVDAKTLKPLRSNANSGKAVFNVCAACHGAEGKNMNFGTPEDPEFVGTVALENPWEFLHKVRFGHPGSPMPGMFGVLSTSQLQDLLAYAQTLPEK